MICDSENLIYGFKACGIHPIDAEQLTECLPKRKAASMRVEESFIQFMADQRQQAIGESRKRRTVVKPEI